MTTLQKLISYYSDKVNIYTNNCFIPLPTWQSCPPPAVTTCPVITNQMNRSNQSNSKKDKKLIF